MKFITYVSSLLLYPVSIASFYFSLPAHMEKLKGEIEIFAGATFLGLAIPALFLVFVYQIQLWISHKGLRISFRKLVAVMLGGVSIIFAQKALTDPLTTNVLVFMQLTLLAIVTGTHAHLKEFLGISGGLSEYGYREL